jgi:hypothetical protein
MIEIGPNLVQLLGGIASGVGFLVMFWILMR